MKSLRLRLGSAAISAKKFTQAKVSAQTGARIASTNIRRRQRVRFGRVSTQWMSPHSASPNSIASARMPVTAARFGRSESRLASDSSAKFESQKARVSQTIDRVRGDSRRAGSGAAIARAGRPTSPVQVHSPALAIPLKMGPPGPNCRPPFIHAESTFTDSTARSDPRQRRPAAIPFNPLKPGRNVPTVRTEPAPVPGAQAGSQAPAIQGRAVGRAMRSRGCTVLEQTAASAGAANGNLTAILVGGFVAGAIDISYAIIVNLVARRPGAGAAIGGERPARPRRF